MDLHTLSIPVAYQNRFAEFPTITWRHCIDNVFLQRDYIPVRAPKQSIRRLLKMFFLWNNGNRKHQSLKRFMNFHYQVFLNLSRGWWWTLKCVELYEKVYNLVLGVQQNRCSFHAFCLLFLSLYSSNYTFLNSGCFCTSSTTSHQKSKSSDIYNKQKVKFGKGTFKNTTLGSRSVQYVLCSNLIVAD